MQYGAMEVRRLYFRGHYMEKLSPHLGILSLYLLYDTEWYAFNIHFSVYRYINHKNIKHAEILHHRLETPCSIV